MLLTLVLNPLLLEPLLKRTGISISGSFAFSGGSPRQIIAIELLLALVGWFYWAVLESSPWRATIGKKLFGIEVTDLHGGRISLARATARHLAKNISVLTLGIGFVMAACTQRRQALHDLLAGCLVVRKVYSRGLG